MAEEYSDTKTKLMKSISLLIDTHFRYFNETPQTLTSCNHEISKTPLPKQPSKSSRKLEKKPLEGSKEQVLLEILGAYPESQYSSMSPLKLSAHSSKISLTDFMGKNAISLLKKTGLIGYYNRHQKNIEFQKIVNQKKKVSLPNIAHIDKMREYEIRGQDSKRSANVSPFFEKPRYIKHSRNERLDVIQEIMDKCDDVFKEKKEMKMNKNYREKIARNILINRKMSSKRPLNKF